MTGTTLHFKSQQWAAYWRDSLADSESGQGALKESELKQAHKIERSVYETGFLKDAQVLKRLFHGEPESVQAVRVVLRPVIYKALESHGKKREALYPDVLSPLVCGLWVTQEGHLLPADPPVIPRDLLSPQADERFTLNDVDAQDRFLSKTKPETLSESEANAWVPSKAASSHAELWQSYYEISRKLFKTLCPTERITEGFVDAEQPRLAKVDSSGGASKHILALYDWLSQTKESVPLLDTYALACHAHDAPCLSASDSFSTRLGHAGRAYPLAPAQRDALAQVMAMGEGELLAINGPPGTGKTTFVLSVVASLWVKAALAEDEPPLIMAASTNNQAVTNILDAFAQGMELDTTLMGQRWLPGLKSFGGYFASKKREAEAGVTYQTQSFYQEFERPEHVEQAEAAFLNMARQALEDDSLLYVETVKERLHKQLTTLEAELNRYQSFWNELQAITAQVDALSPTAMDDAASNLQTLEEEQVGVEQDLKCWRRCCADEPWLMTLLGRLPPFKNKRRLKRQIVIDEQFSTDGKHLCEAVDHNAIEGTLTSWLAQQQHAIAQQKEVLTELHQLNAKLSNTRAHWEQLWAKLESDLPNPTTFEALDAGLDTTLRFRLFQLAMHYWEARWLEDCAAQQKDLESLGTIREKTGKKTVIPRWRRRMKLTPCIVSTLHMLPSKMTHGVPDGSGKFRDEYLVNEIDLLILDEAGQVAPDVAGASMALAKRAIAIGDIHQIKPVANMSAVVDIGNLRHRGLLSDSDGYTGLQENGRCVTDGSVMRIAQAASRHHYLERAEPGMFLREHRRCLNSIIAYCNDLCYRGLLQPLRANSAIDPNLPPFGYVHVDGRAETPPSGSRVNRLEAITVAEWLAAKREQLESVHDKPLEQIVGVVTPFKAQANLIEQECRARHIQVGRGESEMTVGTVHALQGAERPVVLFSGVYSRHDDGSFIDNDPSILNVAVSRAKDSFLVFGDMDVIDAAPRGTPRHLLGRYLFSREENELLFTASIARPDLLELCRKPRVINDAEEHDDCIKELLEHVSSRLDMVSPWISYSRLDETGILTALRKATARGIAVTIYTDHRFNTANGDQTDNQKAARFERCCEALAEDNVTVKVVNQVHSKLVMVDDHVMCAGSYNWACAARHGPYRNMETSILYSGELMEELKLQREALEKRVRNQHPENTV
ncbi:AAA domain-containing protein [Vreelandella boliviensis]|uniref:PLD phosphodiesterase domain-containing protein n=1 Tax=Vreelandella boliviensis LC1 TaxID=1072583 RepID=A0A265DYC2_9GAMM|nr:AAA domain-containing protein [Halomonas boliviensis]EHJ94314.1 hypothetical protein KUC_1272 [Halomonas boliviensis LC1]OZT74319.1 hypothetical protein CE457_10045 [Halomonas boliviensis LC1]